MFIIDYKYIHGTEDRGKYIAIPELDRNKSSVRQFINLADLSIVLDKPTAFIYVDGFSVSQAESGIGINSQGSYTLAVKLGSSHIMHDWIHTFEGKEHLKHANIISSTCAGGIQALYEANKLLKDGSVQEVVIIGGERTTDDTMRLFSELQIPVTCGDGFFYMKVGAGFYNVNDVNCRYNVHDIKWKYQYNRNPFMFTREVLDTLAPDYPVDFVKLHGTGTPANTVGEAGLAELGIPIVYKDKLGHTQGVSSLLETCLVLDDTDISGKVLVTANGFGGFYGAFTLIK